MKKTPVLSINTSDTDKTVIMLDMNGNVTENVVCSKSHTSQQALPCIEGLCGASGISPCDISAITLHVGPGSFTGLRVGAAVGNTIAWLLGISINDEHPPYTDLNYGIDRWK